MIDWHKPQHRVALLQLAAEGRLVRLKAHSDLVDELLREGWIVHTTRGREFVVTDLGERYARQILDARWPEWRSAAQALAEAGEGISVRSLQLLGKRRAFELRVGQRLPAVLNRKTFNAALAGHSKSRDSEALRAAFPHVRLTSDHGILVRANPGFRLVRDGHLYDCDVQMDFMGFVHVAERLLLTDWELAGVMPRAVLSIENPATFHDAVLPEGVLAVLVEGWDTPVAADFLRAFPAHIPFIHFGDFDPSGQAILMHLREILDRPVNWLVPDFVEEYLDTHGLPVKGEDKTWAMIASVADKPPLIERLRLEEMWMEQEAITLDERLPQAVESVVQCLLARTGESAS